MKNRYLILLLLALSVSSRSGAQELIANGSFEDINICTELHAACSPAAWKTASPFLLSYIDNTINKWVGFTVYNTSIADTRQYLQTRMLCPLIKGKHYRLTFRMQQSEALQIKSIAALFSDSIIFFKKDALIKIQPTIDFSAQMQKVPPNRKKAWNRFTTDYLAKGSERYLTIGNYQQDDQQERTFLEKPHEFKNYTYYIDDVSLVPLDSVPVCASYNKTKLKLYSLTDRHPLKRENLFDDPVPVSVSKTPKLLIDTIRLGNVLFKFDSYRIDTAGIELLDSLVNTLKRDNIDFIKINGYTDSKGDSVYNNRLSMQRAMSVEEYLSARDLKNLITDVKGYADRFPVESNLTEEGRYKNRRVEVIIKYKKK